MANLDGVLQQLREEYKQAQLQVEKLRVAISGIQGVTDRNSARSSRNIARAKRTLSAAARRRIAQAQRARWAKVRKASPSITPTTKGSRALSTVGRKKIAAAQRARWAKVKAQQAKKAA